MHVCCLNNLTQKKSKINWEICKCIRQPNAPLFWEKITFLTKKKWTQKKNIFYGKIHLYDSRWMSEWVRQLRGWNMSALRSEVKNWWISDSIVSVVKLYRLPRHLASYRDFSLSFTQYHSERARAVPCYSLRAKELQRDL